MTSQAETHRTGTASNTSADQRLAEIRQEAADRDAVNKADHAKRVAERRAAHAAHNEQQQAKRDAVELERITAKLRRAYMAQPGATEEAFQAALPKLLKDHR